MTRRFVKATALCFVLAMGALGASPVLGAAQEVMLAARGPRFLMAPAAKAAPVEIDVRSSALLRHVVSLNIEQATVGDVLAAIERQTGAKFIYSRNVLAVDRAVRVRADRITVAGALTEILVDAGVDVLLKGNQLALVERPPVEVTQTGTITGRVTDKRGDQPLAGATVVVEGTRRSASTDANGRYRIAELEAGTYTVRARYIGYTPMTAAVTVIADQDATADLALEKSAQRMDEVVTTGTVVPTEVKALPTPITVLTAEDIEQQGISRIEQVFRGHVPGIIAMDQGEYANYQTRIFVRGGHDAGWAPRATIKTYVDGVEVADPSYITNMDPRTIERIEIIRGPQASTIYGAEALEGVMRITTKQGREGRRPRATLSAAGGALTSSLHKHAFVQEHSLEVDGADQGLLYRFGAGYSSTGEWIPENWSKRKTFAGNLGKRVGALNLQLSASYTDQSYAQPLSPYLQDAFRSGRYSGPDSAYYATPNYLSIVEGTWRYGLSADFRPTPWWSHSLTIGYDHRSYDEDQTQPRLLTPGDTLLGFFDRNYDKTSYAYNTTLTGRLHPGISSSVTLGVDRTTFAAVSILGSRSASELRTVPGSLADFRNEYGNTGYFAQAQIGFVDAVFLTAGYRADRTDAHGEEIGVSKAPRVGASVARDFSGVSVKLRSSYGEAVRMPKPNQTFGTVLSPTNVLHGNPDLKPESQSGYDVGVEVQAGKGISLEATYYNQRVDDLISSQVVSAPTDPVYQTQYQNLGQIDNTGWEFQASVNAGPVSVSATYTIMRSVIRSLNPQNTGDGWYQYRVGDQLFTVPERSGGVSVSYVHRGTTVNVGATYIGEFRFYDTKALLDDFNGSGTIRPMARDYLITYPAAAKLSLNVQQQLSRQVEAFAHVQNLLNSFAAEESNVTIARGRQVLAGVKVRSW